MASALALAVDHFVVGEHGTQFWAPVDHRFLLVCEVVLEQLEEDPLGPVVVGRIAGGEHAIPVVGVAHRVHLLAEGLDVLTRRDIGVNPLLDGELLGGKPEGIESHRMQHVKTLHAAMASHDVAGGITLGVPHVESATRWIGKHIEYIVFWKFGPFSGTKQLVLRPVLLPAGFDMLRLVRHLLHLWCGSGYADPSWPPKVRCWRFYAPARLATTLAGEFLAPR